MKPYKTLLFSLLSLFCIGLFSLLIPYKNISLSENIYIRFPQYEDVFVFSNTQAQLLSENNRQKAYADSITQVISTLYHLDTSVLFLSELESIATTPFEYDTLFPHPLGLFYENLQNLKEEKELIRILHYGDSQIENERITSTLRHYLQSGFGGSGKGIVSLYTNVFASGLSIEKSSVWQKVEMKKGERRGNFGLCNAYIYPLTQNKNGANIVLNVLGSKYQEIKNGLSLQALVHEDVSPNEIHLTINKNSLDIEPNIKTRYGLSLYSWTLPKEFSQARLQLEMGKNHILYALSINDTSGIVVDNLAIRGSTGQIFFQNNRQFLTTNYNLLDVKLVIYQFGVNAIPQNSSTIIKDYTYYENQIVTELSYLRSLMPNLPILVIGTSDRSRKNGNTFETNPNIAGVCKAQKNAALKAGCVYWDLYTAMGGENSMQVWANAEPSLANKDFIHFSQAGADKVGKILYKSLIQDYQKYLSLKAKDKLNELKTDPNAKN